MEDAVKDIELNRHWRMMSGVKFRHDEHEPWQRHEVGQTVDHSRPLIIDASDPATLGCLQQMANDAVAPHRVVIVPTGSGWAAAIVKPCSSCEEWHPAAWVAGGTWSQMAGAPIIHPSPGAALCAALRATEDAGEPDA